MVPNRFKAYIGGYFGRSYLVELRNGAITYTEFDRGHSNSNEVVIRPTATQWRDFRHTLDEIEIWKWCAKYPNDKVDDGTQWSFDIAYADRAIKTAGDNSYPDAKGKPNGKPELTETFNGYLAAITKLTGGKTFR